MATITYIEADGERITVDAQPGQTVMEAAVKHGVRGIAAECGGNCVCGTCRIYPDPEWQSRLGEISAIEADMLEFREDPEPGVRLACRIMVSDDLDGLVVRLPENQD